MNELERRARAYLAARQAQERDHADAALDAARTEAHDAFMTQLDIESVAYRDREHAAEIAKRIAREGTRSPRQIAACIHVQTAAAYLRYLGLAAHLAQTYTTAFGLDNGNLDEWAREKIESALSKARKKLDGTGALTSVPPAVLSCAASLRDGGFGASVPIQIVGLLRTEPVTVEQPVLF